MMWVWLVMALESSGGEEEGEAGDLFGMEVAFEGLTAEDLGRNTSG